MPEGHTLHRLARDQQQLFGGSVVHASSPQGRFAVGAGVLDGRVLERAEAYGKHLFHHYSADSETGGTAEQAPILHVHLGLYGKFSTGHLSAERPEPPEPRGALRLRLRTDSAWTDLRGATACELYTPEQVDMLLARLGPDPLRPRPDGTRAYQRIGRSRSPIATLLMDQSVLAGVGNVYRAELLYRHRLDPFRAGRDVDPELWAQMWGDLVVLMRAGVRSGRIVTVRTEDRPKGRATRATSHYVYRRTGLPCRICGTAIRTEVLATRNLFWCPNCQRE
ncbi:Fpg/Nei family DNA glycosylase [uncultured Jatrophihabitans sp.]|uniref:Fpg/Nei family DNA glycosylase n=1 Tax=uncultured Jatrophihabitans sp. TaxID=1610747 RepID=UPI0035CC25A0